MYGRSAIAKVARRGFWWVRERERRERERSRRGGTYSAEVASAWYGLLAVSLGALAAPLTISLSVSLTLTVPRASLAQSAPVTELLSYTCIWYGRRELSDGWGIIRHISKRGMRVPRVCKSAWHVYTWQNNYLKIPNPK